MSVGPTAIGGEDVAQLIERVEASGFAEILGSLMSYAGSNMTPREQFAWSLVDAAVLRTSKSPSSRDLDLRRMFRSVGFFRATSEAAVLNGINTVLRTVDFADTRPREPILLFRVCDPGKEGRMHWSSDLWTVMHYAAGGVRPEHNNAHLFSSRVPADSILAVLKQDEWIVDTAGMDLVDHGPVAACAGAVQPPVITMFRQDSH